MVMQYLAPRLRWYYSNEDITSSIEISLKYELLTQVFHLKNCESGLKEFLYRNILQWYCSF